MGDCAFHNCGRLTRIDLGRTKVRALSRWCFRDCVSLAIAALPSCLQSIGHQAFFNCKALERLEFPATLRMIESYSALGGTGLTEADFRECPKFAQIGAYAFPTAARCRRSISDQG
jgi:hypothetical protein